jgi:tryptophanyl-tRNA synthetase
MKTKPNLISGIQPTGKLHIGNYLGSVKNFVELQDSSKYKCFFFVADLHSLSENFNPEEKREQIKELVIDYLALGLDPKKSVIFQQSQIPAHSELAILLNNITPLGELKRMTQFKDKSQKQPQNINAGLLYYPILMAADIILYDAEFVPIGDDQLQHLELTRTLVRRFNNRFGKTFKEPLPLLTTTSRIMSLNNPLKKMSKSEPEGCIFLDDTSSQIKEKIKKAVTDSEREIRYDTKNKPAISNLIEIYAGFSGLSFEEVEKKFKNKSYSEFKESLASLLVEKLSDFQNHKNKILKKKNYYLEILKKGNSIAQKIAQKKLKKVKEKMGIYIY